ncbi:DUF7344 domain-containing protein [Halostagnicola bangensis]
MGREDHASIDDTFSLIAHPRQRLVLQYFKQHTNPVALDELAARVARWEQAATDPSDEEISRVRTTLQETHLPNLMAAGLIDYDSDDHTIRHDRAAIAASMETANSVMEFLWHPEKGDGN